MSRRYIFDNAAPQAETRFSGLESAYDEVTTGHLTNLGVAPEWRCWEIGAGNGSVARWLAERVGPTGSVLATDLNTDWIDTRGLANLEVRQHDVVADGLPAPAFDLIHARLVMTHLPTREDVLQRLVQALKPGGVLLIEDFDPGGIPPCPLPTTDRERTYVLVHAALLQLFEKYRGRTDWGRTLPWRLRNAGLTDVGADGTLKFVTGGSAGASVARANLLQVGDELVREGLATRVDVDTYITATDDPDLLFAMPILVSAWGRRRRVG